MDAEEELRGFIDNDQFVSFRWFANFLNINVEQSKKLFDEFKASNNDVFATYCVSGQLRNKQQSITIVPEDHLARCKDLFLVINCIHIYSLQKKKFQQSSTISAQLNAADIQQANELIAQQPSCESFLLNSVGGVRLDGSHVKPIGKRVAAMVRVISVADKTDEQMMKSFAKVGGGIEKVGVSSSSSAVKDSGKENSKEKSKASSSVANAFFAKAAAASSSAVNAVTPVATAAAPKVIEANKIARKQSAKASSATEPLSTKLASVADDDKDDDEEDNWTEEGAASYKPDKKRLQNMKKANVILEADEGVRSIPPAVHDPAIDEASSEARKTVPHVRGAMDDYMEDVAVEQYNSGGHSGGDAASISGGGVTKRTKKKLVEKMFADAKGYLITEMVWEDVSDDDDEATHSIEKADPKGLSGGEKRPAASDISNTDEGEREDDKKVKGGAKGSQVTAKKVKKSAAPVVQQKGMMSFFGKK